MASYTSSQAGNWSSPSTWGGSGPPGNGDTVTVNHLVTVDVNTTVGNSPATNLVVIAITPQSGRITVPLGVTLRYRGGIQSSGTSGTMWDAIVIDAGGSLICDASQATPTTVEYSIAMGTANNQRVRFVANGTAANPCTISSDAGGGNGKFTRVQFTGIENYFCTFTNFVRWGSSGSTAVYVFATASYSESTFTDCVFDACGQFEENTISNGSVIIERCTWKNTVATSSARIVGTGGTRIFRACYFDKSVAFFTLTGGVYTGNTYADRIASSGTQSGSPDFSDSIVYGDAGTYWSISHGYTGLYLVAGSGNPHFCSLNGGASNTTVTLEDIVIDASDQPNDSGDALLGMTGTNLIVRVRRTLILPNLDGEGSGSINANGVDADVTYEIEHCTGCITGGLGGSIYMGEGASPVANRVVSVKSNIFWSSIPGNGYVAYRDSSSSVQDIMPASATDKNCVFNNAAGTDGNGYHAKGASPPNLCTGTPGTTDLHLDPQFVDSTRNIKTWDAALGGPGTSANVKSQFQKRFDWTQSGYTAGYTVAALRTWVKEGFRPQNAAIQNAGHDGVTIGALELAGVDSGIGLETDGYRVPTPAWNHETVSVFG